MTSAPMLADFSIRLAFGLAVSLLLTSWRAVPLTFFRTQAQVMLGLLVLAVLDLGRLGGQDWIFWSLVAGAALAYLAAVTWGLGLPQFGRWSTALVAIIAGGWLYETSRPDSAGWLVLDSASRLASGLLLGTTLTAMLLGHHYLTAPSMSIDPLKRVVALMALSLLARCVLAGIGLWWAAGASVGTFGSPLVPDTAIFLAARWGMGFAGAAIATFMTWRTAQIRSTQSATGILYIAMIFVLFGELTSMVLASRAGVSC